MKKLALCSFLLVISPVLFAEIPPPPLNIVSFQIQDQQWVNSSSAKVYVAINISTNAAGLKDVHEKMMEKLNKLSSLAEWHITSFSRSEDQSGLEKIVARAEVRLPDTALSPLREKAKQLSQPGFALEISNINLSPSEEEMQQAQSELRAKVYQKINTELANLNKEFPDQHYVVHKIDFNLANATPQNRLIAFAAAEKSAANVPAMQFSQRVYAIAQVEFASDSLMRKSHSKLAFSNF